jgi:hypothetical protein
MRDYRLELRNLHPCEVVYYESINKNVVYYKSRKRELKSKLMNET